MGLIGDTCSSKYGESMSGMAGCKFYNTICSPQAFAKCNCSGAFPAAPPARCESALSAALPVTKRAQHKVRYICAATNQDHVSCDKCTAPGDAAVVSSPCRDDPLDVLSDLCTAYPANANCTEWGYWCGNNSASALVNTYCKRPQNQSLLRSTLAPTGTAKSGAARSAPGGAALLLAALLLPLLATRPAGPDRA